MQTAGINKLANIPAGNLSTAEASRLYGNAAGAIQSALAKAGGANVQYDISPYMNMFMQQAQAGTQEFDPQSVNAYMNPYQQNVVDIALARLNEEAAKAQSDIKGEASRVGAFGGSREAIQQSELEKNRLRGVSDTTSTLLKSGYDTALDAALGAFNAARGRNLTASGLGLQGAGTTISDASARSQMALSEIDALLSGARGLGDIAAGTYAKGAADIASELQQAEAMLKGGTLVQTQNQRLLDIINQLEQGANEFDYQQLQRLAGILGAYPTTGTTATSTVPGASPYSVAGGLAGIVSTLFPEGG
jgi:hypothetical protein